MLPNPKGQFAEPHSHPQVVEMEVVHEGHVPSGRLMRHFCLWHRIELNPLCLPVPRV